MKSPHSVRAPKARVAADRVRTPRNVPATETEAKRLLHELQVHQVELKAQNEELVRLRDELAASLAGYTDLYENAPVAYLTLDADGRITQFNRLAPEVLGLGSDAFLGELFVDLFPPRDRPALLERMAQRGDEPGQDVALEVGTPPRPRILRIECRAEAATGMRRIVMIDVTYRRGLEQAVLDAGHREQLRLGADLHDGLGQELAGIRFRLASIVRTHRAHDSSATEDLLACESAAAHAMGTCRALARGLSPLAVYHGGLAEALRELVERMTDPDAPQVILDLDTRHAVDLPASSRDHLFRIAQEALNNARRHSGARSVRLSLAVLPRSVTLEIADDGCGIAPDCRPGGLGLGLMRHRANLMNARLTVTSLPAGGTRVVCVCEQPVHPRSGVENGRDVPSPR